MIKRQPNEQSKQLAELGFSMDVKHVPYDIGKDAFKHGNYPMIKFWITLSQNGKNHIGFDYSYGIGHLDGYKHDRITIAVANAIADVCKYGVSKSYYRSMPSYRLVEPQLADVIHCLLIDSEAAAMTFDEWCSVFECNSDSIKDKEVYEKCRDIGIKFNRYQNIDRAREILQDY